MQMFIEHVDDGSGRPLCGMSQDAMGADMSFSHNVVRLPKANCVKCLRKADYSLKSHPYHESYELGWSDCLSGEKRNPFVVDKSNPAPGWVGYENGWKDCKKLQST